MLISTADLSLPLSVTIPASWFMSPDLRTTRAPTLCAVIYSFNHRVWSLCCKITIIGGKFFFNVIIGRER